jgi:hypothetical protein
MSAVSLRMKCLICRQSARARHLRMARLRLPVQRTLRLALRWVACHRLLSLLHWMLWLWLAVVISGSSSRLEIRSAFIAFSRTVLYLFMAVFVSVA